MNKSIRNIALGIFIALSLGGCSAPTVVQYADQKPVLDLSEYFAGTINAYGIFTDRSGRTRHYFGYSIV